MPNKISTPAVQCLDCKYIGVPDKSGRCAKCGSDAVTRKVYTGKDASETIRNADITRIAEKYTQPSEELDGLDPYAVLIKAITEALKEHGVTEPQEIAVNIAEEFSNENEALDGLDDYNIIIKAIQTALDRSGMNKQAADMIHSDEELSQKMEPATPAPEAGPSNTELVENSHSENGASPVLDGDLHSPERANVNAMREALEAQAEMEVGKAQPLTARLLTPAGWKFMGDIRVGDLIIGSQGTPVTVTGVYPQGYKDVFKVTFDDKSTTECCDEHLWQVTSPLRKWRGKEPRVLSLGVIRTRLKDAAGNRQHFIPMVKPVVFSEQVLPIHPYLLGALLGDGSMKYSSVGMTDFEGHIISQFSDMLPTGVFVKAAVANGSPIHGEYRLSAVKHQPNNLRRSLAALGLVGHGADDKFIPPIYLTGSIEQRVSLLQGLLDTDGSAAEQQGVIEFGSNSEQLLNGVIEIVQSLGGCAYKHPRTLESGKIAWRAVLSIPNEITPFRVLRKLDKVVKRTKYHPTRSFESAEWVGNKQCQCIKVDAPDQLYVTDDYIVTHNTIDAKQEEIKAEEKTMEIDAKPGKQIIINIASWDYPAKKAALMNPKTAAFLTIDEVKKAGREYLHMVRTAAVQVSQGQDSKGFHMLINMNGKEYALYGEDAETFRREYATIPKPEDKVNALVEKYIWKLQPYQPAAKSHPQTQPANPLEKQLKVVQPEPNIPSYLKKKQQEEGVSNPKYPNIPEWLKRKSNPPTAEDRTFNKVFSSAKDAGLNRKIAGFCCGKCSKIKHGAFQPPCRCGCHE